MDQLLIKAVKNNVSWCDLVVRKHGNSTEFTTLVWYTTQPVPEFYPNLIVIKPNLSPVEKEKIYSLINSIKLSEFSVKDSFCELDLSTRGFKTLFDANWIVLKGDETRKFSSIRKTGNFMTHISDGVVGITNVSHGNESFWPECISFVRKNVSKLPIVGYERGKELEEAKRSGFEELGKLRVLSLA